MITLIKVSSVLLFFNDNFCIFFEKMSSLYPHKVIIPLYSIRDSIQDILSGVIGSFSIINDLSNDGAMKFVSPEYFL